jgi:mitochondrial import inner membrane translocase subunit TIM17
VKGLRKKEDPWNGIAAGFMTGGSLALRSGFKAVMNGAIACSMFVAVIEGVRIIFNRVIAENTRLEAPESMKKQQHGHMSSASGVAKVHSDGGMEL